MYRQAIELDLNFASPHAGLAFAAIADYASGWAPDPAQALIEAERWARRALELNDQEPVSHMALGNVLLWQRDHEGALAELGHMMALDPNFAQGHTATGLALMYSGEPARALEPFAKAMRLDPHYPDIALHFVAQANFSLEKYSIAAQQLLDRIARNPGTDASRMLLASCYGHLGARMTREQYGLRACLLGGDGIHGILLTRKPIRWFVVDRAELMPLPRGISPDPAPIHRRVRWRPPGNRSQHFWAGDF